MGNILYFDCFSGISGDMTLGALMDLGLEPSRVRMELEKLNLKGFELQAEKSRRYGITGMEADVIVKESHGHGHGHEHSHGRNFKDIKEIILNSTISSRAKELSINIFTAIAEGEAKVHGKPVEQVHFHEVGALDSIIDIVGTAICIDMLDIQKVFCSVLVEGNGFIECEHGILPVPVPAVVEMLKGSGIVLKQGEVKTELVTPTGLGILKGLGAISVGMPMMNIVSSGMGFGKREIGRLNALRIILGKGEGEEGCKVWKSEDEVFIIEANLDDESGEVIGYTLDLILEAGALDAYCVPIQMKKCRPGVILTAICSKKDVEHISGIMLTETTSLGVRISSKERIAFQREIHKVETPYGIVRIKVGSLGEFSKAKPEYDDCARIAKEKGMPISDVFALALRVWQEKLLGDG
ncbi:MAG: nickel pincer cofactor biosynthesis protein LarC [Anaerovoracaceae bacterium]|jgi:uncharacterized protein (TIGR00299 family) protein